MVPPVSSPSSPDTDHTAADHPMDGLFFVVKTTAAEPPACRYSILAVASDEATAHELHDEYDDHSLTDVTLTVQDREWLAQNVHDTRFTVAALRTHDD